MEFITKKGRKVEIRMLEEKDYMKMKDFINSLVRENTYILKNRLATDEAELEHVRRAVEEIKRKERIHLVAFYKNILVGSCDLRRKKFKQKHIAELAIAVRKGFRNEGIGKKLMEEAIKLGKKIGIKLIILEVYKINKKAIALYKKLGFKKYGELPKGIKHKRKYLTLLQMYRWVG